MRDHQPRPCAQVRQPRIRPARRRVGYPFDYAWERAANPAPRAWRVTLPAPPTLPVACFLALLALLIFTSGARQTMLLDNDPFMNTRIGGDILREMRWPLVDTASFTFEGAPYIAHEWLFQALTAALYRVFDLDAFILLGALGGAAVAALVAWRVARENKGVLTTLVTTALSCGMMWSWLRPRLISQPGSVALGMVLLSKGAWRGTRSWKGRWSRPGRSGQSASEW